MILNFTKMQSLGNDFVLINAVKQKISLKKENIKLLADRKLGIGCDQVLLVEPPDQENCDFFYRIYNSDGNEVNQCGNGARCFATFVGKERLTSKNNILINTNNSNIKLKILDNGEVLADLAKVNFDSDLIPFLGKVDNYKSSISIDNKLIEVYPISVGNPHAIVLMDANEYFDYLAPKISNNCVFPDKTNVSFVKITSDNSIDLRVFERGVGETFSCGSAAAAATALLKELHFFKKDYDIKVNMKGGTLLVKYNLINKRVSIQGITNFIFKGSIVL